MYSPDGTAAGVGNMVSVEFNLVYRWHSCISKRDDEWTQEFYKTLFPGKDTEKLTMEEFMIGLHVYEMNIPKEPSERTIAGFKRGPDGSFSDDDLVEVLVSGIEDTAGMLLSVPSLLAFTDTYQEPSELVMSPTSCV